MAYKGFDLLASFQGAADVKRKFNDAVFWPLIKGENAQTCHLDRVIVENDVVVNDGFYPRTLTNKSHNQVMSSFNVLDASYLRLKNIQLGYTLPDKILSKINIQRARVYISGQNLLTFSSLPKGFDPELPNGGGRDYPQVAFYTFGIDITF